MGILGGSRNILPENGKQLILKNQKNSIIPIDAFSILYNQGIGSLSSGEHIVDENCNNIIEIYICFITALKFRSDSIIPVFVFDGKMTPDNKSEVKNKRNTNKEKSISAIKEIVGNTNEEIKNVDSLSTVKKNIIIQHMKRSFHLKTKNVEKAKELLKAMGIPVVDAVGEADPQCAAITKLDNVLGIYTNDITDAFMYSAKSVLKIPSIGSNFVEQYTLYDTLAHICDKMIYVIETSLDEDLKNMYRDVPICITLQNLRQIGCMMGSDYCKGGLKVKKLKEIYPNRQPFEILLEIYAKNNMNLDTLLKNEDLRCKLNLSDEYIDKIHKAMDTYNNSDVIAADKLDLELKKPNVDKIRELCKSFIDETSLEQSINTLVRTYNKYINGQSNNLLPISSSDNDNCLTSHDNTRSLVHENTGSQDQDYTKSHFHENTRSWDQDNENTRSHTHDNKKNYNLENTRNHDNTKNHVQLKQQTSHEHDSNIKQKQNASFSHFSSYRRRYDRMRPNNYRIPEPLHRASITLAEFR